MQLVKQIKAQGGVIKQFSHESVSTKTPMTFSIFLPPTASESHKVPALFYLAGLTCSDDLLFIKAPGAIKVAAERGIAIVATDTRCARGSWRDGMVIGGCSYMGMVVVAARAGPRSTARRTAGTSARPRASTSMPRSPSGRNTTACTPT